MFLLIPARPREVAQLTGQGRTLKTVRRDNEIPLVKRGFEDAVRTFAIFGSCVAAVVLFYHLPLNNQFPYCNGP